MDDDVVRGMVFFILVFCIAFALGLFIGRANNCQYFIEQRDSCELSINGNISSSEARHQAFRDMFGEEHKIYVNEQLVKIFESGELTAEPKADVDLDAYYTPERTGKHVVKAYVLYADKKTDYEVTAFEVQSTANYLLYVVVLLAVVIIIGQFK